MKKILFLLSLVFVFVISCDEDIVETPKEVEVKEVAGESINFDDIDSYEIGDFVDLQIDIVLPAGSKVTASDFVVSTFVSDEAQIVNSDAGYVVMAENANGESMLLGYALAPSETKKSLANKSALIQSKATYNNSEISCRSTMLSLVMMNLGKLEGITSADAMEKVLAHAEFNELIAKFTDKFNNDPIFLEKINEDKEIKDQIQKISKEVLNQCIDEVLSASKTTTKSTGLIQDFNWASTWDKYEPWDWHGEANWYNVYDAPFLAICEKSNVPLKEKLAIANPANINFIADFYDESGKFQDYRFVGRNSTLIQKAIHSGASQTTVLTDVDFVDGFDPNKTYKVILKKCLLEDHDDSRHWVMTGIHILRIVESTVNIVADGSIFSFISDICKNKKIVGEVGGVIEGAFNSENMADITSTANISSILETAVFLIGKDFIKTKLKPKSFDIILKIKGKVIAKTSNPAGWAVMVFEAVNDFASMAISMAACPSRKEYTFNLAQNKIYDNNAPNISIANISPNNGQEKVDNPATFTWDGSATEYQLLLWATDDPSDIIHFPKSTDKNQTVKNLDFGKEYKWQITAYSEDGYSVKGNVWNFKMANGENQKPSKPVAMYPLGLSEDIPTSMRFEWTKSTDPNPNDLIQYKLTYFYEKNGEVAEKFEKIVEETHYDAKLKAGQTYYWQVNALDDRGAEAKGNVFAFATIPNTAPSKPVLISPTDNATDLNTEVEFSWNASSDVDEDDITYEITVQTGDEVKLATTQNTSYSFNLATNSTYTWSVTANDNNSGKNSSKSYSFSTESNHLPTAPILLSPANGVTNVAANVTFKWSSSTDVDEEEVSYTLFIVTPNDTKVLNLKGTTHTEKLEFDTDYSWFVKASDGTNIYVESETLGFRTVQSHSSPLLIEMIQVPGSNFEIGKYEVTQALWEEIMNNNPSRFKGKNLPVESITYYEIKQFLLKLNDQTGRNYRLPSKTEWILAAQGGDASKGYTYAGSDQIDEVAWYKDNSENKTHPVGTKNANEIGIYDMSGNVYEWTNNYTDHYSLGPGAPAMGGNWSANSNWCTTTFSDWRSATSRRNIIGLRLLQHY